MNCVDTKEPICAVRFSPAGEDGEFCLRDGHRQKCHDDNICTDTVSDILTEAFSTLPEHGSPADCAAHFDGLTAAIPNATAVDGFTLKNVKTAIDRFNSGLDRPKYQETHQETATEAEARADAERIRAWLTERHRSRFFLPHFEPFRIIHPVCSPYIPAGTILNPPPPDDDWALHTRPARAATLREIYPFLTADEARNIAEAELPRIPSHRSRIPESDRFIHLSRPLPTCVHGCEFHHTNVEYMPDGSEIERQYSGGPNCRLGFERVLYPGGKSGRITTVSEGDSLWPRMPIEYGRGRIKAEILPIGIFPEGMWLGKDLEAWARRQKCVAKFNNFVAYTDAPFEPPRIPR